MTASALSLEDRIRRMAPVTAPADQQAAVAALSRAIEGMVRARKKRGPKCKLVGPGGNETAIPESVFYVLERVAEVMARGDAVTVVPVGKELTTQQAADLLNVSRQYLVRLLEDKRIPFCKTGKHRRLRIEDVLSFKGKRDKDRRAGKRDPGLLGLTGRHRSLKLSVDMHDQDARAVWEVWQARKQASYDADQRALASGDKTRKQLIRENGAVPTHIAEAPLPWDEILSLEW